MAPATGTALLILVTFVLPGFVARLQAERTYLTRETGADVLDRVLGAIYLSVVIYAVFAVGALAADIVTKPVRMEDLRRLLRGELSLSTYVVLAITLFTLSFVVAEFGRRWAGSMMHKRLLERMQIDTAHRTPSGWEHYFEQGREAFVRVVLDDGRVIGGFFNGGSFAGYTSQHPDLYIREQWQLDDDDWFDGKMPATDGIFIRADAIRTVEFFEPQPAPPNASVSS